ncbi:MAG: hypothetical protein NZM11_00650 [Anaerolineales bacterium]|nr:hypothetical protein [Anaerolineales bacterium]
MQDMLLAQRRHRLLVVPQAMDTGSQDSMTRKVFEHVNSELPEAESGAGDNQD